MRLAHAHALASSGLARAHRAAAGYRVPLYAVHARTKKGAGSWIGNPEMQILNAYACAWYYYFLTPLLNNFSPLMLSQLHCPCFVYIFMCCISPLGSCITINIFIFHCSEDVLNIALENFNQLKWINMTLNDNIG